ncbi:TMV resistance protein N-like [Ipomoea triloba]|uniref:TMV resistance protein N-like n=1 Tax=Ipomoea triloba TaxID=35885 RepID=UPI00125CEDED|nr:TMV resistance protein N-like [Ipomoea triloba]
MNVAKYPVGIESHVGDVLHLLQIQTNDDVQMMEIFGMGGVGKSTITKAIYNHLILSFQGFEGSCFVANIRQEVSNKGHNGLVGLQEKILHKILKRKKFEIDNVDEGISLINARLQSKRVLIVLDDVDHISQLQSLAGQRNWFGLDTTIIITTRDVHLLSELGTQEKYMVKTLSIDDSLQLLSWHVVGVPIALKEYTELSKMIASYTGGLPLALTIVGSHLRGRSVQEWIEDVEKLRSNLHDDIQKILKISYDALDDDTKNIFLDIACFFVGHGKKGTAMILEACGFYAESGIKILIERCLLTIDGGREFGRLEMHDLVQNMGREIVRKEFPREPSKRSRLVDPKDVFDVLQSNKHLVCLRTLKFDGCTQLKSTPNFTGAQSLQTISFSACSNLANVHPSIGSLERLVRLDFWKCKKLKEFRPLSQGSALRAEVQFICLKLYGCKNLRELPIDIGKLEQLRRLDVVETGISHLPFSLGSLRNLESLDLGEPVGSVAVDFFPSSTANLCSLESLSVSFNKLQQVNLPIAIGSLTSLTFLKLSGICYQSLSLDFSHP